MFLKKRYKQIQVQKTLTTQNDIKKSKNQNPKMKKNHFCLLFPNSFFQTLPKLISWFSGVAYKLTLTGLDVTCDNQYDMLAMEGIQ